MEFCVRRFCREDAAEVADLIAHTLRTSNSADYASDDIEALVRRFTPAYLCGRMAWTHMYLACDGPRIVGCGAIGPYEGSEDESCLFTIFVLPAYQGRGAGRLIMRTLENDEFYTRALRVEIPASITACAFYETCGYGYKGGVKELDEEQLYRMEKYR